MKKRIIFTAGILMTLGVVVASWIYNANLVNETALAYNNTYTLNLNSTPNQNGINTLSAQAIYSSATLAASTFTDGRVSTGSITVVSASGLSASTASATITLAPTATLLAQAATDQITIVSTSNLTNQFITFTGISGSVSKLTAGTDWFIANTTSGTAASIASALSSIYGVDASQAGSVIYASATIAGSAANSFSLATSVPASISTASFHFTGGHDAPLTNASLVVNGQTLMQGYQWSVTDTSSGTATSIANILGFIPGISASATGSVVFATATAPGTLGNTYSIVSSSSGYMTVSNFASGKDNAKVCINGPCLTQGTDWTAVATTTGTAKAISDAIDANSILNKIVVSTWNASSVVSATSTAVGVLSNYSLSTTTPALTTSGSFFKGGLDAAWTLNTGSIFIPNHGYTTAYQVVYSSAGTSVITGLTNKTTYYAIVVDSNHIELATTSTGAVAGTFITLASSSTTGPHTYSLSPTNISGTASAKWQASNDCSTWFDLSVSSLSFGSPYTAGTTSWDFGSVNYTCIRFNAIAPTTGGWAIQVRVNGK